MKRIKRQIGYLMTAFMAVSGLLSGCGGGGGDQSSVARNILYVESNLDSVGENYILAYNRGDNGILSLKGS